MGQEVYQFKITLKHSKPAIWRRIQVPSTYTFWNLHGAIQDSMGWGYEHLHEFMMLDPKIGELVAIGSPDEMDFEPVIPEEKTRLSQFFSLAHNKAEYIYDFGDNWEHKIVLEKILEASSFIKYPICVGGARACPPENCGGIGGYEHLLAVLRNPAHEEYKDLLEWLGGTPHDPETFNPEAVTFMDSKERRELGFF